MKTISIDRLLNSVGTNTFVTYFFEFKELNKKSLMALFKVNNEIWKENSYKQKANNGKRIFKEKREIEALEYIILNKKINKIPNGKRIKETAKIYYSEIKN